MKNEPQKTFKPMLRLSCLGETVGDLMDIIYQQFRAEYTPIFFEYGRIHVYTGYKPNDLRYEGPHDSWSSHIKSALSDNLEIRTRCTALIKRVANVIY